MRWTILMMLLALPAYAAAPDSAATTHSNAELNAIRNELACYCGCGMTVQGCLGGMVCSESRTLSQEVIQLSSAGKSRPEILQAMVAKYGERILSAPTKEGFNLVVWGGPFVALLLGVGILAWLVWRWRRTSPAAARPVNAPASGPSDGYGDRFEQELRQSGQ